MSEPRNIPGNRGIDNDDEVLRARGYEAFAPDRPMFTTGGGGLHCLCQAPERDPAGN